MSASDSSQPAGSVLSQRLTFGVHDRCRARIGQCSKEQTRARVAVEGVT